MYRDARSRVVEQQFGQPQTVLNIHSKNSKHSTRFVSEKKHNSESISHFACVILNLVGMFRSLSYEDNLKGSAILNQALCKCPPNMKESWSSYTVERNWFCPNLLDFNEWLKEKIEKQETMKKFLGSRFLHLMLSQTRCWISCLPAVRWKTSVMGM